MARNWPAGTSSDTSVSTSTAAPAAREAHGEPADADHDGVHTTLATCARSSALAPPAGPARGVRRARAGPSRRRPERVIVAFGDSLTAGPRRAGRPDAIPRCSARGSGARATRYRVVNAGVSGDTTAGGLRRVDWALRLQPEIVILELGANDALRGQNLAAVRANLDQLVTRFQAAGARVLLAGMRLPPNYGHRYAGRLRPRSTARWRGRARRRSCPFFLDGVGGDAAAQPGRRHPSDRRGLRGSWSTASGPTWCRCCASSPFSSSSSLNAGADGRLPSRRHRSERGNRCRCCSKRLSRLPYGRRSMSTSPPHKGSS